MFFELIGTIMAGVAMALLVWAVNRVLKGRLPSWLIPVSAGLAMLIATISSEYSWFERTRAAMPEGFEVAQTVEEAVFYRPWTYAKPFVSRFVAVDKAGMLTHPAQPDRRMVDLVFYGRWAGAAKVSVLFDCAAHQRADVTDAVSFGENGSVAGADWAPMPAGDPVLETACAEN